MSRTTASVQLWLEQGALQPSMQTTCGAPLELRNIVKRQQDFLSDVMQMCRGTVTVAALARALSEC